MDYAVDIIGAGVIVGLGVLGVFMSILEARGKTRPKDVLEGIAEYTDGTWGRKHRRRLLFFERDGIAIEASLEMETGLFDESGIQHLILRATCASSLARTLVYENTTSNHNKFGERGSPLRFPWGDRPDWAVNTRDEAFLERWAAQVTPPGEWLTLGAVVTLEEHSITIDLPQPDDVYLAMTIIAWLVATTLGTQEMMVEP